MLRLALISFLLNLLCRARLRLGSLVDNDTAIVTAARGACPMRETLRATLALHERSAFQSEVSTVLPGLAPVMSHSDDHTKTISKYSLKDKPALVH